MARLGRHLLGVDGLLLSERNGQIIGMLGFIIHDHFISGEKVAGEVFWWVEPEYRGGGLRLLREMEKRARAAGCKCMHMISPDPRVDNLYRCLGYEYVEATYQKAL
jgi:GNAT superfamily N-acetyltransferase